MEGERLARIETKFDAFSAECREWMKEQDEKDRRNLTTFVKVERMEARAGIIAAIVGIAAGFLSSFFHKGG